MNSAWLSTLTALSDGWAQAFGRATLQGGFAVLVVWLIYRAVPSLPGAARSWLWRLVYLRLLLALCWPHALELPLLPAPVSPPSPAPLVVAPATATVTPENPLLPLQEEAPPVDLPPTAAPPAPVPPKTTPAWSLYLAGIWLLGVGWCAARIRRQGQQLTRLRSQAVRLEGEPLQERWQTLCERARVRRIPELCCLEGLDGPTLLGGLPPMVVLPKELVREWPPEQTELALAHELAHVKRADLLWNWLPALAHLGFYFHPLLWLATREWRLAQEMACDALALRLAHGSVGEYASMLLRLAHRRSQSPALALHGALGAASESPHSLRRRLEAMKNTERFSSRRTALLGGGVVALVGMFAIPFRVVAQSNPPATSPEAPLVQVRERPAAHSPSDRNEERSPQQPERNGHRPDLETRLALQNSAFVELVLNAQDREALLSLQVLQMEIGSGPDLEASEARKRSLERCLLELTTQQIQTNAQLHPSAQELRMKRMLDWFDQAQNRRPKVDLDEAIGFTDPDVAQKDLHELETQVQASMTELQMVWGTQPPSPTEEQFRKRYERAVVRARLLVVEEELERAQRERGSDHPRVWQLRGLRDTLSARAAALGTSEDRSAEIDALSDAVRASEQRAEENRLRVLQRLDQRRAAEEAKRAKRQAELAEQSPLRTALNARLDALDEEIAVQGRVYGSEHPKMRALQDARAAITKELTQKGSAAAAQQRVERSHQRADLNVRLRALDQELATRRSGYGPEDPRILALLAERDVAARELARRRGEGAAEQASEKQPGSTLSTQKERERQEIRVNMLRAKLAEIQERMTRLRQDFTPKSPEVRGLQRTQDFLVAEMQKEEAKLLALAAAADVAEAQQAFRLTEADRQRRAAEVRVNKLRKEQRIKQRQQADLAQQAAEDAKRQAEAEARQSTLLAEHARLAAERAAAEARLRAAEAEVTQLQQHYTSQSKSVQAAQARREVAHQQLLEQMAQLEAARAALQEGPQDQTIFRRRTLRGDLSGRTRLNRNLEAARKREREGLSRQFGADRMLQGTREGLSRTLRQNLDALPATQRQDLSRKLRETLTQVDLTLAEVRNSAGKDGRPLDREQHQRLLDRLQQLQAQISAEVDRSRGKEGSGAPAEKEVR